jgi:hypothetical protein
MKSLAGKKTYLALLLAAAVAWLGFLQEGMTLKESLAATLTVLVLGGFRSALGPHGVPMTLKSGETLQRLRGAGLMLACTLALAVSLSACTAPGGAGLAVDPLRGLCAVSGDWSACWHPLTKRVTATHRRDGRSVVLEYDARTGDYRGQLSSAEGALVYDSAAGLRLDGPNK